MTLHLFLRNRCRAAYRQLAKSLAGLEEADAFRAADPAWRRYRHGTGLDGSIAGVVRHVAAWKHAAAAGLRTGVFPDADELTPPADWTGLRQWLDDGQGQLERLLSQCPPAELERSVTWEGQSLPVYEVWTHLIEHDQYHAGQVNLLRQQMGHRFPE